MKMKRALLLAELEVIAPALADKSPIPGLDCIWFDSTTASTYNNIIGIEKPLETEFVGGIPGKILLGYLNKTSAEEITFTVQESDKIDPTTNEPYQDIRLEARQSRLKLPLQPISNKIQFVPNYEQSTKITLTKDFFTLLNFCLVSIPKNVDQEEDERSGVTFEADKQNLNLYTTDSTTLSWARLSKPQNYFCDRLTIAGDFCEQLQKICAPEDSFFLSENAAIAVNRNGTTLFGRIVHVANPLEFSKRIPQWLPKHNMISVPPELDSSLDRAELLRQGKSGDPVQFTINGETLHLYLKSSLGEFQDEFLIEDHPQVSVMLDPTLIKRALAERTCLSLSQSCLVMSGPDSFTHIISTMHQ